MKIVQISKTFSPNGGVGTNLLRLLPALKRAGYEITVIHADPLARQEAGLLQHCVKDFAAYAPATALQRAEAVLRLLEKERPEVVHFQDNENLALEREVLKRYAAVKTLWVYDFCPSGNKFHHALDKACSHKTSLLCVPRMVYKRCVLTKRPSQIWMQYEQAIQSRAMHLKYARVIAPSNFLRQQALASGYPSEKIMVVPLFVPERPAAPAPVTPEKIILFVGRIVREKGWKQILDAAGQLPPDLHWRLHVVGDGPDLGAMKNRAHNKGLADKVVFWGWQDDLERFYRQSWLVAVPAAWPEPFGIVGLEAMSYAKPVAAFDTGGISEWLDDGKTGLLAKAGDARGLAEKIGDLLRNPEKARAMGEAGCRKAATEFSEAKTLKALTEIYRGLDAKVKV